MAGSRYRKKQKDLSSLDPNSQEYWEEILRREGLSMSRGQYPQRVSYGWNFHDTDKRNATQNTPERTVPQPLAKAAPQPTRGQLGPPGAELGPETGPQSKPIADNYGILEDDYSEVSEP